MAAPHPERQRGAHRKLAELFAHRASVFVIHYACQSLAYDQRQGAPRITAVATRNLESGEVTSFSIHAEASLQRLSPVQVLTRMDALEQAVLDKTFDFLKANRAMRFVHWNMRDEVFGFAALDLRHGMLGGVPFTLPEASRIDLANLLKDLYGNDYADGPLFESLARMNAIASQGMLAGKEEAEAFERGEYAAVRRSTLAKVSLMYEVLRQAHDRTLKTRASWWELNIGRVREAVEMFQRNPVHAVAGLAIAIGTAAFGAVVKWLG